MSQKYRVTIRHEDGREYVVMPKTRKTTLFPSVPTAIKALDARSKRLRENGWIGRIYETPDDCNGYYERRLKFTMAL